MGRKKRKQKHVHKDKYANMAGKLGKKEQKKKEGTYPSHRTSLEEDLPQEPNNYCFKSQNYTARLEHKKLFGDYINIDARTDQTAITSLTYVPDGMPPHGDRVFLVEYQDGNSEPRSLRSLYSVTRSPYNPGTPRVREDTEEIQGLIKKIEQETQKK